MTVVSMRVQGPGKLGLGMLAVVGLLAGCALPTARENVDRTAALVAPQSGARFAWRRGAEEDAGMLAEIDPLLADGLTDEKAIAVALLASPDLQLALEKLEVARAELVAATTPPNPVAIVGVRDTGGSLAAFYPQRSLNIGVLQNVLALLNMPGRRRTAQHELERVRLETADRIVGIAAEVNQSWVELVAAERILQIRERVAAASRTALDTIVAGAANGKGYGPIDVGTERNTVFGAEAQVVRAQLDVATARARLAQQMGIAGLRDGWRLAGELPPLPATDPDAAALERRALEQRLDLRAARKTVLARLQTLSTTRQFRWLGQLELGAFRESTTAGTTFIGPNAMVELPVFDQRQAQLLSADAELRSARRTLQMLEQNARNELRTHAAEVAAIRSLIEKYRDFVVPNQNQLLAQLGDSVESGSVDGQRLRISALAAEEEAVGFLRDYWRARGALARAAGDWGAFGVATPVAAGSREGGAASFPPEGERELGAAAVAMPSVGASRFTLTPALVSDYDLRGISQNARNPALQLGAAYAFDSGFYLGAWGSNVELRRGDPRVEVNATTGFRWGDARQGAGFDAGVVYYGYINKSDFNYPEVYFGLTRDWFGAKLFYSWDYDGTGFNAWYVSTTGTFPLPWDLSLAAHAGYSGGDYWDKAYGRGYLDWSVGLSRTFGKYKLGLAFVDGSDLPHGAGQILDTRSKVLASISTTLPWSAD